MPSEVQLPMPAQGWQWEIPPFAVAAGTEIQSCTFFDIPGDASQEVWVDRVTVAQNPGSHHMNLFRVKTILNLTGQPGDVVINGECFKSSNWADWPLVINSQDDQTVDWQLPVGVGMKFHGGERLMLQTHYVNATTQKTPGRGKVLANFYQTASPLPNELGTVFATNQNIRICPGTSPSFESRCVFPSSGITIVGANGHFHSRGVEFTISPVDAQGVVGATFYRSTTWDSPPMARDLSIGVPPGGGIDYRCSFECAAGQCGDPQDGCCFKFGGHVDSQEHCNAFVYYYPKVQDINCF